MTDPFIERLERAQLLAHEIKVLERRIGELDQLGLPDVVRYCQEMSKFVGVSFINEARTCASVCLQSQIHEIERELKAL